MPVTINLVKRVGDDELLELSRLNPGYQFERHREGALAITLVGAYTSRRTARLCRRVVDWNDAHGLGVVFDSSAGFLLPDTSVLSPDVAWVRNEHWHALTPEQREGILPLCPDVTFEVRQKRDTIEELRAKMVVYCANGAELTPYLDVWYCDSCQAAYGVDQEPARVARQLLLNTRIS